MTSGSHQTLSKSYLAKEESYYTGAREDYVELLPTNPSARVLELGCGNGATGELALRLGKAGFYLGIEAFEPMAARARGVLTEVIQGDVEHVDLPLLPASFDALIASEVFEHLTDPSATLDRLVKALKPGALVMASSPNIAHWSNVLSLIRGRFEYTDSGMMDKTHLRWFTPDSFRQMFADAGINVTYCEPLQRPGRLTRLILRLIPKLKHMTYYQINLHGTVASSPEGRT